MTRVYLINLSFGVAGIERRFANVWRVLNQRGNYDARLVIPDTLGRLLDQAGILDLTDSRIWLVPEPVGTRWLGGMQWQLLGGRAAAAVRSRIMARAYRPVWAHIMAEPGAIVHIGLNCSGLVPPHVPTVYECVDSTLTQLGTRHYIRAAGKPCIVHCQTERIRTALVETHRARLPRWRTEVSPCYFAAYPDQFPPGPRDPGLVAFVGRFSPEKNPLLFVEALARARAAGAPVRGLMLGKGPLCSAIKSRASELGLSGHLQLDFVPDPAARLAEAAVCVNLQSGDNYGSQALLEAMGAGCAIVASDVGETRRLVTPEVGICCALEAGAVASAFARLVGNPAATAAMGAAASRRARTDFSADAYVGFVEFLYREASAHFTTAGQLAHS